MRTSSAVEIAVWAQQGCKFQQRTGLDIAAIAEIALYTVEEQ